MRLHSQSRKRIAVQPPRRVIPNFPHISRPQSPHRTRRHRRRHLPSRQHVRRPKRHLRPAFRILQHRNNRVRSVQPHPNQIHSCRPIHPTSIFFSVLSANSVVNRLRSQTDTPPLTSSQQKNIVIPSERGICSSCLCF